MAVLDISKIRSPKELEKIARRDLEGRSLAEIARWIKSSDLASRVKTKGNVGYVIERGYFGIEKNSNKEPDLPSLGVEVKTSPLKPGKDGLLRVKEPLSLNIINYTEEANNKSLKESSLYKKNHLILFVWYVHDASKERSHYIIKYVFLWEIDDDVVNELKPDYDAIIEKINKGKAHQIHQFDHRYLTICPKHNGCFRDPNCTKSKTKQPFSDFPAEVRAFRLKNSYMNIVIKRYLLKERPGEAFGFVGLKKI